MPEVKDNNSSTEVLESFGKCTIDLDKDLTRYNPNPAREVNVFYNQDIEVVAQDPFEYENW